jgi:hypothetical protein
MIISEMQPEVGSMNTTPSEQIAPEIVQAIIAKAMARGMSVNDYLRQELGLTNGDQLSERPFYETATPEEWIKEFTKWADSHDPNTPALPIEAVSRESIYSDSE